MKKCKGKSGRTRSEWEEEVQRWSDHKIADIRQKQLVRYPDSDPSRQASQRMYNRVIRREARARGLL